MVIKKKLVQHLFKKLILIPSSQYRANLSSSFKRVYFSCNSNFIKCSASGKKIIKLILSQQCYLLYYYFCIFVLTCVHKRLVFQTPMLQKVVTVIHTITSSGSLQ